MRLEDLALIDQEILFVDTVRDALSTLLPFARRAEAPGAEHVPDDGTVTFFMADCRAALEALRRCCGTPTHEQTLNRFPGSL